MGKLLETHGGNKKRFRLSLGSKPVDHAMAMEDQVPVHQLHRTLSLQPVRYGAPEQEKEAQNSPLLHDINSPTTTAGHGYGYGGINGAKDGKMRKVNEHSKEENFSLFRTRSTRGPSRQPSIKEAVGAHIPETTTDDSSDQSSHLNANSRRMPADRYFDALEGPELEILKGSEDALLPLDKPWPFLLRFPITCFGISLGLGSQSILWKRLHASFSVHFLHIPPIINIAIWCLALCSLIIIFCIYFCKCLFYFEAVKKEYYHPVRVNFFFAPWIACMFLTIGVPPAIAETINPAFFCIFMAPVFMLELKIYGQWLSGGERRLSKVANPSSHLSVVGNFVGARLATLVGYREAALFLWAVGLAHYLVLFVTLYQRLPTSEALPRELHPVYFLFIAAPCTASVAWESIAGHFDDVSRIVYFIALFLLTSLIVRIKLFRGLKFSLAWWAYIFPTTAASIATVKFSNQVKNPFTQSFAFILSIMSTIAVTALFITTLLHAFYWGTLFSNDVAIAITHTKRKPSSWRFLSTSSAPTINAVLPEKPIFVSHDHISLDDNSCGV